MGNKLISIANDHAATDCKNAVKKHLLESGYEVNDYGTNNNDSVDYPDYAVPVCKDVLSGRADCGILICGTGIGMSMAANKFNGIRAAVCTDEFTADATRAHNDANVLCLGARVVDNGAAVKITDKFLNTEFEGGKHLRRINKFTDIENKKV